MRRRMVWPRPGVAAVLGAAVGGAGVVGGVGAAEVVFNGFGSVAGLSLNVDAAAVGTNLDGTVLRVAPSEAGQRGSAFTTTAYNVGGGFSTFFTFRLHTWDTVGFVGGDGLTFTVQADPRGAAAVGEAGEALGYGTVVGPGVPAIGNSAAIEFDLFQNGPEDRNDNHVALDLNGSVVHSTAPGNATYPADVPGSLRDMRLWYAWVDYDGANIQLRMS